jgi:hypothetical protein
MTDDFNTGSPDPNARDIESVPQGDLPGDTPPFQPEGGLPQGGPKDDGDNPIDPAGGTDRSAFVRNDTAGDEFVDVNTSDDFDVIRDDSGNARLDFVDEETAQKQADALGGRVERVGTAFTIVKDDDNE